MDGNTGGELKRGSESAYARYLADVVRHFHDVNGVTLSYVSPMNEPDYTFAGGGQEGMAAALVRERRVRQPRELPRRAWPLRPTRGLPLARRSDAQSALAWCPPRQRVPAAESR